MLDQLLRLTCAVQRMTLSTFCLVPVTCLSSSLATIEVDPVLYQLLYLGDLAHHFSYHALSPVPPWSSSPWPITFVGLQVHPSWHSVPQLPDWVHYQNDLSWSLFLALKPLLANVELLWHADRPISSVLLESAPERHLPRCEVILPQEWPFELQSLSLGWVGIPISNFAGACQPECLSSLWCHSQALLFPRVTATFLNWLLAPIFHIPSCVLRTTPWHSRHRSLHLCLLLDALQLWLHTDYPCLYD